jgi:hypothetical protein
MVDIASSWWEGEAIASRSQQATKEGMDNIRRRVPFRILEIHPDNDSGLINELLWRYCKSERIKMSRSRPYKKNDNAWVEQRNWTHVRKMVGYQRFDTTGEMLLLRELYEQLRLYKNFFQPTMKLVEKVREGGKILRRYDQPKTPCERLLASGQLSRRAVHELRRVYSSLNVAELHRKIEDLRDQLFKRAAAKAPNTDKPRKGKLFLTFGRAERRRQFLKRKASQ